MQAKEGDLDHLVRIGLEEDVGSGDWTTLWTVPEDRLATARIISKARGVIAGTAAAAAVFARVEPRIEIAFDVRDGDSVDAGAGVASIHGPARGILTGERLALNLLQRLSGVATATRAFVEAIEGTGARILDTRKTTPGMRALEKMAVRSGGGANHRFGLHDMILIKENHIRAAGGITAALDAVRRQNDRGLRVEVETTNLDEVTEAIAGGANRILLDNMPLETLRQAVEFARSHGGGIETEASGGVTIEAVRAIAETGVDYISVGALTHSAPALDLSLLFDSEG